MYFSIYTLHKLFFSHESQVNDVVQTAVIKQAVDILNFNI